MRLAAIFAAVVIAVGTRLLDTGLARDTSGMWDFIRSEGEARLQEQPAPAHDENLMSRPRPRPREASNGLGRHAVCVRLCDGFFFPVGDVLNESNLPVQEASCAGLCPGAPTRLYVVPQDGDGIQSAVTRDGHPYSALPVALRYTRQLDATCTCRRGEQQASMPIAHDVTLRRGDVVMTAAGLKVYSGSGRLPYGARDFVALAAVPGHLENAAQLAAIDKAAKQPAAAHYVSQSIVPAAPQAQAVPAAAAPSAAIRAAVTAIAE